MSAKITLNEYLIKNNQSRQDNYDFLSFLHKIKFKFNVPFVHVTGTNGKGSVTNFIANIYEASGYKTGCFTSPFFKSYIENISINNVAIREEEGEAIFEEYYNEINKFNLTQFEVITFIALYYFVKNKCDIAAIEVGMGGLYDATNIEEAPVLAIINNVDIEHSAFLGRSKSEIAYNKAGIIKDGCPVLINRLDEDCTYAVNEVAKKSKSKVYTVSEFYNYDIVAGRLVIGYYPYPSVKVNTSALYQRLNVACALEAIHILNESFPIKVETLQLAFDKPCLDGRFTTLKIKDKRIIIDGAHNPLAIETLIMTLDRIGARKKTAIVGVFRDKNVEKILAILGSHVDEIFLTTFEHERARTEDEFFVFTAEYQFVEYKEKFEELLESSEEDIILITGSLYFSTLFLNYLKTKKLI